MSGDYYLSTKYFEGFSYGLWNIPLENKQVNTSEADMNSFALGESCKLYYFWEFNYCLLGTKKSQD